MQFSMFGIDITENIGLKYFNLAPFCDLLYSVTCNVNKRRIDGNKEEVSCFVKN